MAVKIDKKQAQDLLGWVKKKSGKEVATPQHRVIDALDPMTGKPSKDHMANCLPVKLSVKKPTANVLGSMTIHYSMFGSRIIKDLSQALIDEALGLLGFDVASLPVGLGGPAPGTKEADPDGSISLANAKQPKE